MSDLLTSCCDVVNGDLIESIKSVTSVPSCSLSSTI